jgi:hypothetical protein
MKPIRFKQNLKVADEVRKAINRLNTDSLLMKDAWFETFDNCREQGYVLKVSPLGQPVTLNIAFSEHRSSDDIVVYVYHNTRHPSNLPATDEDWKNVRLFRYDELTAAAGFILTVATSYVSLMPRKA